MKYRKKSVVIEAHRMLPTEAISQPHWLSKALAAGTVQYNEKDDRWEISTLEGIISCSSNDWIIKGVKGELYPCRNDVFEEIYEKL
jgi:hypothetical protein